MIDRFGNYVQVGWSNVELLWLRAALELPLSEQPDAFRDIADMAGRKLSCVKAQAYAVARHDRQVEAVNRAEARRLSMERQRAIACEASGLRPPTKAQLMGTRASPSATTGMK